MSDQWQKVNELFYAAQELPEDQRPAFIKEACGQDDLLRNEVEALLKAYEKAGGFIQTPPLKDALEWLADTEEPLTAGQRIGAYKVIREIGRGGMGAVYLAARADEQYEKYVAIKLIKRGMDTDSVLRRFRNERQILAVFDHPNIARLLDGGTTESGLPYFVMEYVEGQPIDEYCDSRNLSMNERLQLFRQVCAAVSYAHRHLVVHRDIKPSNIVVTNEGDPKLLDFGIAKILDPAATGEASATATGIRPMTPEYASPEQARGMPVTTMTDLYSMGVVLYELLTGVFPYHFENRSPIEVARVITETDPVAPSDVMEAPERLRKSLRGDLDNIVLKAIRKEPERRYQSVEELSEDIRRHLEGLPILARKDTPLYRSAKFVRRNKTAVVIAALAFLTIAVSAVVAGVIQWRANQQAKFLQEFGQEAAGVDAIMRFAYLLPLHDTSAEREIVMKRIRSINTRMAELGGNAQGPGHYAIGRGFMALQRYEDARKHFEHALKTGYRTSEVAYSYGLTLAMLYQAELQIAARISNKELRETRLKEIKQQLKEPALSYIREGSHSSEYSEYAEATVEFLDEHYEKAIQKSETAMQQKPWLYESKRLEGEAYRNLGGQLFNKGDHSKALDSYTKADQAFGLSIQKGASDPLGYVSMCNVKSNILSVQLRTGVKADNTYAMARESCQKALVADPKNAAAYLALSNLYSSWASDYTFREMNDRRPFFEQAIQAAQKAIFLQPENFETHKALGLAYAALAWQNYQDDMDPSKAVVAGKKSFEKAIQLNPNDVGSYVVRGRLLWSLADHMRLIGADPRKTADEAYQSVQTAIRINPNHFGPYHTAGNILWTKGAYEKEVGLDPTKSWDSAFQMYEKSLKINPGYMSVYIVYGFAAYIKAEYQELVGRDPYQALSLAEDLYQKALRIDPNLAELIKGIGYCNMRRGEFSVDAAKDPTEFLTKARSFIKRALDADKTNREFYDISGQIELVAARWKMLQHQNPDAEMKSALQWEDRSFEVTSSSNYYDAWDSKARMYRRWAEWKLENKQSPDKEIQLGLAAISKALQYNPRATEMIATRGVFLLFQARSIPNEAQRKEFAGKAHASLVEALKINRNLSHNYAPFLKEAESLSN